MINPIPETSKPDIAEEVNIDILPTAIAIPATSRASPAQKAPSVIPNIAANIPTTAPKIEPSNGSQSGAVHIAMSITKGYV